MLLIDVTLFTRNLFFRVDRVIVCDHASEDLMIVRPMTSGALHVQIATHVDVVVLRGEVETLVEVTMLDAVAASAIEVTFAAVLTRRCTDRTRRGEQINTFSGVAEQAFAV